MNESTLESYLSEVGYNHFKLLVVPEEAVDKDRVTTFLVARGWHVYNVTKESVQVLEKSLRGNNATERVLWKGKDDGKSTW